MGKLNEIYKYLNTNQSKEKYYLVSNLVKKFDVTKKSAEAYYYKWKREYMQTSKCVPKDLVKTIKNKEVENVEKPIIINTPNKPTEEKKSNLEVTSMTIKGQYADYIRDGDKVICGEEVFYSIDDLEEYKKKEIANFYARLGEIYEVFELEVR
ncbi:hypothetical protein [Clostridium sp.]|uniref:hypothetical protein n=1 Tax=Clostridium sp. TaxID=1506 RepID=UPI001D9FCCF1|nr:hypothetical protein [Clostridium sp.]MBS5937131.1 hypothetical protein [Clostridium sp.]